jgi:catechol 2,3-dioxygenase-like lactoylglutathione lyase family enzyme
MPAPEQKRGNRMAEGIRIAASVMFVRDLDRSVRFYQELLTLEVTDRSPTAAMLVSPGGAQLVVRAMGPEAQHALGGIGVQYVVWVAGGEEDLRRCEKVLQSHAGYRGTNRSGGVTAVEGTDPDGVAVVIVYPGPDRVPVHELPTRVYAW